jgi:hypothetical protein
LLTPYPATPLYDRLLKEGRLTRPQHWLDFKPFRMAFSPKGIEVEQAEKEVRQAWTRCYEADALAAAIDKIRDRPFGERAVLLFTRLMFRGIYFPQMNRSDWVKLLWSNRNSISRLVREGYALHRGKTPKVWPSPKLADSYRSGDA